MAVHRLPWQGFGSFQIMKDVAIGKREEIPEATPKEFKELIELCWNQNPKNRNSFEEITTIIQEINMVFQSDINSNPKLEDLKEK